MKNPAIWRGDLEDKLGYERLEWKKRIVAMADFLDEDDHIIMDLGAGNMHLRRLLIPGCQYIPVDYKKNASDTVVCDFNKKEFPAVKADAIIAAGILEYIKEPLWFIDCICAACDKCILSYKGKEKYSESILSSYEVIEHMAENGFVLTGRCENLEEWTLIGCFERVTPEKLGKQLHCSGCGACANICPTKAITMEHDADGFYKPIWNKTECIGCNKCIGICPKPWKKEKNESVLYAAWADDEVRRQSSSGGIFYMIAVRIIDNGGYVFGVRYDKNFHAITDYTNKIDELPLYMHYKYVQSYTGYSYKKVKELLERKKEVLFVGTPCQIAGLKSILGSYADSQYLYTIDLICFGVPSDGAFQRYLHENYELNDIEDIVFRDKEIEGWSPTGYKIKIKKKNGEVIHKKMEEDTYSQTFHGVLFRNYTCENCEYYKLPRLGDITIGDFWGIDVHDKTWNDGKGTSAVLVNTEHGVKLWDSIRLKLKRVEDVPLEWCADKGNRIITNAREGHPNKEYFFDLLKTKSFNEAVHIAAEGYHDVGLVCMMNYNIGNNLTNYALYTVIKKLGYTVRMIEMPSALIELDRHEEQGGGALHYFLKNPYPTYDYYKPHDKYELYEKNESCGMYVVGADQLWRDIFIMQLLDFCSTLDWLPSDKYKISYATSTGTNTFEASRYDKDRIRFLLKRFNKVSVREKCGQKMLENWGIKAKTVLDPVFLCERQCFDAFVQRGKMRTPSERYVAAYLLDINEKKENFVLRAAQYITGGLYEAMTEPVIAEVRGSVLDYTTEFGVEEWVAMIKDAEFVITDSFHGMCFALIYEKPFYVVFDKECWRGYDRFTDLLTELDLYDRIITQDNIQSADCEFGAIDYERIGKQLKRLKNESFKWLKNALLEGENYQGFLTEYDFYLAEKYKNHIQKLRCDEILKRIQGDAFFQKVMSRTFNEKNKNIYGDKMVVIGWGAGMCFRKNLDDIRKYSEIKYVCDSNPDLWGSKLTKEITCISPSELLKFSNPLVLIMVENAQMAITISNTLLDMGIIHFEHVNNWLESMQRSSDE